MTEPELLWTPSSERIKRATITRYQEWLSRTRGLQFEDYAGLWSVRPGLAVAMAVFMLALLGFPIFGGIGFFAKWYVLQAALQSAFPQTRLALILVVTVALTIQMGVLPSFPLNLAQATLALQ